MNPVRRGHRGRCLVAALVLAGAIAMTGCQSTAGASSGARPSAQAETSTLDVPTGSGTASDGAGAPSSTGASSAGADPSAAASADPSAAASADPSAAASASAGASAAAPSGPCPAGMILVSGGTMRRHKPNAKKTVTVATYCMDRAEVTVAAYKECVKEKKCSPRCLEIGRCSAVPQDADWPDPREAVRASTFCNGARSDRDEHPVNCVSFDEAKGFCQARDKRLPTGDEWEWAAIANEPAPRFPWGPEAPDGEQLCWGKPFHRASTCLPGSFKKDTTRDGVVDMAGNLSEWVVEGTAEKPRARLRGSSWYAIDDGYIQAALWGFESTSARSEVFGFRCAKDAARP